MLEVQCNIQELLGSLVPGFDEAPGCESLPLKRTLIRIIYVATSASECKESPIGQGQDVGLARSVHGLLNHEVLDKN